MADKAITKRGQRINLFTGWLGMSVSAYVGLIVLLIVADVWFVLEGWKSDQSKMDILRILDIPVILPPLVIGLSLLILFNNFPPESLGWNWGTIEDLIYRVMGIHVTNTQFAVVMAQFTVAAAFAVRTMKATFDQIDPRNEKVAMTLGATRGRAFADVVTRQGGCAIYLCLFRN